MNRLLVSSVLLAAALLGGCDMLGIESPEKVSAARDADGKAIGGACRHAARAIEDCFALNKKADRAAIFAGWRDMNDYMRENKIDPVTPQSDPPPTAVAAGGATRSTGSEPSAEGGAKAKGNGKPKEAKQADS